MSARIVIENIKNPKLWKTINLDDFSNDEVTKIVKTYARNKQFRIVG